ncbi:MAG: hypothetical protein M5U16_13295 [Hyphomicrobium sp.]|nr:hypothetical protein [Hyphomicrobium sp.]
MFGKEAADLSIAEQFVLASAVNRPIILLEGSERLNAVRLDRWRYLIEVRARTCAEKLISDEALQKEVVFELVAMAAGPPIRRSSRGCRMRSTSTRPASRYPHRPTPSCAPTRLCQPRATASARR